ncbi:MAG: DNA-directed RNA polymerase subunit alpha [Nitrospira sp.]|nr:DNA-directed RNA polymerase subunit alpha [bacterium]MBL7049302.1 DNA-directed RNA polymerase subunit alpha [Nitrospira sp.]
MDLRKKGFQLPENINFDADSLTSSYGKLYAEAFERGFGTTIGNSLRRILLSSIEGSAVTAIRLPGVLHEFSNVQGVKEDIIDMVLNIKHLRVKLHGDEPKVVTVNKKGPGFVTGADLSDASVEVMNKDQHIATLEKDCEFSIELNVESGKGYVTAEQNKEDDQAVDIIPIDAIFTPIEKVNFWVEDARVGRSTDYDKLVLEVWTDGSISPQDAVAQAAGILNEHMALFTFGAPVDEEETEEVIEVLESAVEDIVPVEETGEEVGDNSVNENLLKNVEELELSVRSYNCLKNANIRTISELVQKTEQEMLRTKNFGRKSLDEIKELIISMGLHFNMRVDNDELQKLSEKRMQNAT